jgi:hypothetical protein
MCSNRPVRTFVLQRGANTAIEMRLHPRVQSGCLDSCSAVLCGNYGFLTEKIVETRRKSKHMDHLMNLT